MGIKGNKGNGERGKGRSSETVTALEVLDVPAYVELSEGALQLWPLLTRARAHADWRELDLMLLARIANLEVEIRDNNRVLARTGPVIPGPNDRPIENPLVRVIDTLARQQASLIRSLSLATPGQDPRQTARDAAARRKLEDALKDDPDGLIARPQ